jgi:hypothetical protein
MLGKPKRLKICLDFRSFQIRAQAAEIVSAPQSHGGFGV